MPLHTDSFHCLGVSSQNLFGQLPAAGHDKVVRIFVGDRNLKCMKGNLNEQFNYINDLLVVI